MAIKILATGDLHLGKRSSGIPENPEESSTKFTWNRIFDWSIKNEIDLLLLTGDIIDQDNRYYEAIGPLQAGFEKLNQANITVYMIAGNHDFDVLPEIVRPDRYNNVYLLGFNGKWEVKIFSKNREQIQFVGWSFPNRYVKESPLLHFSISDLNPNIPSIALLHGDVENRESKYAPVEIKDLINKPINTWILGHIHKPQELRKQDPLIWYPGSPHAMSAKEPGIHGPLLLTLEGINDFQVTSVPLSPVRYEHISIDITKANDKDEIRDTITSALFNDAIKKIEELEKVSFMIYDVYLEGRHTGIREIETWTLPIVNDYEQEIESGTRLLVRQVVSNVKPVIENLNALTQEASPAGILADTILSIQNNRSTAFLDELLKQWNLKFDTLNNSGTYQPLRATEKIKTNLDEEVKTFILRECNRLLGELMSQQVK